MADLLLVPLGVLQWSLCEGEDGQWMDKALGSLCAWKGLEPVLWLQH